ncbi:hypothetical protein [Brevundimonas basaltis]|uniref:Uncharacterized protein n=1 Tax=Brevundimonas basaltis TaxID=472166 RepID=A0A7W8MGP6_9CAUL|nr:hypothetical protein [Brevundimonas basaltis]MBB5292438.1 hypothetical protein [Brevundimonas basaltis]
MVSFQKDRSCQCRDNLKDCRQDTAACVSLSRSTISKTQEPENRSHRLSPGCGGGGDVVASLSGVKRSFRRTISFQRPRPEAREALFSASFFCVKRFFLKKNLCLQTAPEDGGGGSLRKAVLRVNRAFSAILRELKSEDFGPQKTVWKAERLAPVSSDDSIGARNLTETP